MPRNKTQFFSRRAFVKGLALSPLVLRSAPFFASPQLSGASPRPLHPGDGFPFTDFRLAPHYPARSPLADVLRLAPPGSDQFVTEGYAFEIAALLQAWSESLRTSAGTSFLAKMIDASLEASSLVPAASTPMRTGHGIDIVKRTFAAGAAVGREGFLAGVRAWLGPSQRIEHAEFEITGIQIRSENPLSLDLDIRYDVLSTRTDRSRASRIGTWQTQWTRDAAGAWKARRWEAREETLCTATGPAFTDITAGALGGAASYVSQLQRGVDHWRTVLDAACGIDVYGNNGISVGDFDNDGFEDLYVCQPAGLPNRLYRNRGDGTFEDVTESAGVGVLDGTACALFADFDNKGFQDLLVVCGSGPLLFLNQGNGTFSLKRDAFQFAQTPEGSFTHAAVADYDRDGRLDIYLCTYSYYLGLDQYHYPVPYFDARNGPANFLLHNEGGGTFVDRTEAAGMNVDNSRYSFACAWGESGASGFPDLFVANDFGRANLYRNNGNGTFTPVAGKAHVEDAGAGMSAAWTDYDNDGKQDIYIANMWSAAGQRVAQQPIFHEKAPEEIRALYRRHARGNALYRNLGDGTFSNVSGEAGVEMGRWSWCSDFWDFDHDGYPDLYIANGYISAPNRADLGSFFWRQVVAKSPDDATPSAAYEHGWNALNELIRSDSSWSGYERNVMYANNRDGTFSDVSGILGLDFPEDGRSFALADIDHDGRLEVILKNRNAPQVRILHNDMQDLGDSIAFRLAGGKSNRDGIGAAITVECGTLRQTKYLQAGSGFLAQHTKEVFFGLGHSQDKIKATILWPSGLSQDFDELPRNHRVEIHEGTASVRATPFAKSAPATPHNRPRVAPDPPPSGIETWLIEPLKAPDFALPDLAGKTRSLSDANGSFVLLTFWTAKNQLCREQLRLLGHHNPLFAAAHLLGIAVNVDEPGDLDTARAMATQLRLPFPVLFATAEIAGVYNLIYRYLFDRRRDLPIPASFLLDRDGLIVKVYQGALEPAHLLADVKSVPAGPEERRKKALPFGGVLYQGAFARNDFTYGVAMFQHGYFDQAADFFQQVVAAKPDDAEAYYNLGTLNLRKNDFAAARRYLDQTVKLRPNYPEAWNNLGMLAAQQGHADEAVKNFEQSLRFRPSYAIALLNLGNLYRRKGDFAKAQELLSRALELQPDDPEANYSLGMLYAQQNQVQTAQDYLQRALALRPEYPEALNNLGVLYVHQRDYARAEEQFRKCVMLVPGYDQSYLNLARLYGMQGDKEKARAAVQDLLRLQPDNPAAKQALLMLQ
jgi:Flp pilus assembly protein TadD/peroxiredoxin